MGDSKQTTTQTATQSRDPWAAAIPGLQNVLGQTSALYGATTNSALPGALTAGQNQAIANAQGGATTAAANGGLSQVGSLINSGGSTAAGTAATSGINSALGGFNGTNSTLSSYLSPIADGSQIGAGNTAFETALQASLDKARDTIGSQFAGAGRYGSASMGNAEATSLGNIAANATSQQYNQDKANQLAAIGQLSGINTSGLSGNITGNTTNNAIGQDSIANLMSGIGSLPSLNTSQNLDASNLQGVGGQSWTNLDNAASLYSAIGGMGGTGSSNGTSTVQNQASPLGMLLSGVGAVGNLFAAPTGGTSAFSAIKGLFSDRRLKQDVERIGELRDGQAVYRFRYVGDPTWHMGLMAQEVLDAAPEAVGRHESGFLMVDYGAATARAAAMAKAA